MGTRNCPATAATLLTYYPLPNGAGESNYNYENFQSTPARTDGADLRIDHTVNSKRVIVIAREGQLGARTRLASTHSVDVSMASVMLCISGWGQFTY